jgi:uncharacterized protein (DUF58 family)
MGYLGERSGLTKSRYASMLAAAIAYLVLQQQDRAGLLLFSERAVRESKPARADQLSRICAALDAHQPASGTDAEKGLEHLVAPGAGKGLVVLASDAMVGIESLTSAIDRLRHRGHDLALLWILDPDETDLAVATVSRFDGLEGEGALTCEPRALRQAYMEQVDRHRLDLQRLCRSRSLAFVECRTDEPLSLPLNRLLVALHADRR